MVLLIVICAALPILALAAQRDDFKRMGLIAVGLEAAKFLLFLFVSPNRNEFLNFVFVLFFFVAMLPEMMIGGEFGPSTVWQWTAMLCAGVVWNFAPAYFLSLFLPDLPRKAGIENPC